MTSQPDDTESNTVEPIVAVKLISGEELVARLLVAKCSQSNIALAQPFAVGMVPSGNSMALSMMPFMPYADEDDLKCMIIAATGFITIVGVSQSMADAYNERTGRIVVARPKIVVN